MNVDIIKSKITNIIKLRSKKLHGDTEIYHIGTLLIKELNICLSIIKTNEPIENWDVICGYETLFYEQINDFHIWLEFKKDKILTEDGYFVTEFNEIKAFKSNYGRMNFIFKERNGFLYSGGHICVDPKCEEILNNLIPEYNLFYSSILKLRLEKYYECMYMVSIETINGNIIENFFTIFNRLKSDDIEIWKDTHNKIDCRRTCFSKLESY